MELVKTILEPDECEEKFILKYLNSSNSDTSDSDGTDDYLISLLASTVKNKRQSIKAYVEETVENYSEEEFGTHFRLSKSVYLDLIRKYEESEEIKMMDTRKSYSAKVHITLFLWFAAHEAVSFRDMSDRFDLSLGTVSNIIERVTYFISNLSSSTIIWPNEGKQLQTMNIMEQKTNMKGIIGAMDGTHIRIMPPKRCRDDYIDRKNTMSICLQAICNEKRQFTDIFVGFPGSAHDSRVFENSDIYLKLPYLCGNNFILADSAYKCSRYVLTPYRDNGRLTRQQKIFNRKLSSGRIIIEHSFGMLKQRFRQLYFCKLQGIEKLCHFIKACCVLHNLCGDDYLNMDEITVENSNNENEIVEKDYEEGSTYRDRICRELNNSELQNA